MKSKKILITTDQGVRLTAEFDLAKGQPISHTGLPKTDESKNPLVILIHGWEGSSQSAYQVTTANHQLNNGFDVLRLNLRDHGDSHHLNKAVFNSTLIEEVGDAIKVFTKDHKYSKTFLAGFSLGGNFTLRITADRAKELNIAAAVAVCPPVDPNSAMTTMNNTLFIYEKYFFRRWTTSLKKKLVHFPELNFGADIESVKTLEDINRTFIPKFTPFADAKSYFSAYGLIENRLQALAVPAHLIASEDDPILPINDLDKINPCKNLVINRQKHGGHCGFILNVKGESWISQTLVETFKRYID
ncbi:MAG: alpha/beta fold hydrolase [Porticoccaceae bacterium]|nr:alpha/beta fold hydrolase [Porticoccaceae bacterium]